MSCFNKNNNIVEQHFLPSEYNYNNFFPNYKIIKPNNSIRNQLKGTRLATSEKILENEYYNYTKKYPWIEVKCFELIHPKEKYIFIKINNKNSKNKDKIIIFSNGESSNICGILPILIDISSFLRLNIITYEYPKKNHQNLNKKEQEMFESTLSVISYVYASPEYKSIILMGYSTGVYLNYKTIESLVNKSKKFTSKLKHIINISPIWCFDSSFSKKIFHNRKYSNFVSNLIKDTNLKLKISTFVSHGVKDSKIGYMISIKICSRLNFVYEWYPKEGDHYNIFLKDIFRRKLFKRLKEFLSVEDVLTGNDSDNSVISKLTNEGIKVNITKDLDISSGNFFFKNNQEKNDKENNKDKNNKNDLGSLSTKGKFKIKGNNKKTIRKESGFSFLDISIQKTFKNNEFDFNMNEINNEDDFDMDESDKNNINNIKFKEHNFLDDDETKGLEVIKDIDNENDIDGTYNEKNNINNINFENNEIFTDIKYNNNENLNNINENKGALINDSFGNIQSEQKIKDESYDLSFGK